MADDAGIEITDTEEMTANADMLRSPYASAGDWCCVISVRESVASITEA